jgi:hypothetical protein
MDPQASSSEGIYALVDFSAPADRVAPPSPAPATAPEAPPAPAPTPEPPPAPAPPAAKVGLLGRLLGRPATPEAPATPPAEAAPPAPEAPAAPTVPKLRVKRRPRSLRFEAPAWAVSLLVHVGVLGALGLATITPQVRDALAKRLDTAMIDPAEAGRRAEEPLKILADPVAGEREEAVAAIQTATPGVGGGLGTGTGPPSATPRVGARSNAVAQGGGLPSIRAVPRLSGLAMLPTPTIMARDLGAGGAGSGGRSGVVGDVTYGTKDIGEALDQLAREILRHLSAHKLTVVWMFDESESMKDDQRAVKDKFDRVASELKVNVPGDKKLANVLNHAIVGFGESLHFDIDKPTTDIDQIRKAIDRLRVDPSGTENTLEAVQAVVARYTRSLAKDRRLLIVLVTDESGDDGKFVEEARQAVVSRGVPLYVIGRQSLFGYSQARLLYIDPVTKDPYWPTIRRGPESADVECLQYDGLHDRWDEQPSGFAPYELARLAKDSGGIYFLLPSEETMRVRQREKAYSIATLKEYVPDYEGRNAYFERRGNSELRRTLYEVIQLTSPYGKTPETTFVHRRHYPIDPGPLMAAMAEEGPRAQVRLKRLLEVEKKLRSIQKYRDREPDKRWQAHYDLILAQIVTYQVKAYEYMACLDEMVALARKGQLKPKKMPVPGQLVVEWVIDHSKDRKAPTRETEKKYAEAERLLKLVIERHPKTPWADLAQDEINRGFGCQRNEWHHDPRYDERAKLVPKY